MRVASLLLKPLYTSRLENFLQTIRPHYDNDGNASTNNTTITLSPWARLWVSSYVNEAILSTFKSHVIIVVPTCLETNI